MRKGPLENHVESYLVKKVEGIGGMALKGDIKGRRFIDRICILPGGETWYVECKRPQGGVYSAHQVETMGRLTDLGHYTVGLTTREAVDEWFSQVTATPAPQNQTEGVDAAIAFVRQFAKRDPTYAKGGDTDRIYEAQEIVAKLDAPAPQTREVGS